MSTGFGDFANPQKLGLSSFDLGEINRAKPIAGIAVTELLKVRLKEATTVKELPTLAKDILGELLIPRIIEILNPLKIKFFTTSYVAHQVVEASCTRTAQDLAAIAIANYKTLSIKTSGLKV